MADYEDTKVTDLVINNMSQEKFDELKAAGELDPTQLYCTPEEGGGASLPDQTDNAGKFLTTDGTTASWGGYCNVNDDASYGTVVLDPAGKITSDIKTSARVAVAPNGDTDALCVNLLGTAKGAAAVAIGFSANTQDSYGVAIGASSGAKGWQSVAIGYNAVASADGAIQIGRGTNSVENTFGVMGFEMMDANGNVPRERLKNLVEVLPTAENGYTTVKNYGNGYVEITGYTAIGTVGAGTGSEVQIDLPAGYTMADINYWVNIAPTSETTMFDFKAEAKARSTTHFMVAYKNEDTVTGLTAAGVYWEVRGMLATTEA